MLGLKYAKLKPTDTFIFRGRHNRQHIGLYETDLGPAYGNLGPAARLHKAIMKNDPEMKNAFTPEAARQYLEKSKRNVLKRV